MEKYINFKILIAVLLILTLTILIKLTLILNNINKSVVNANQLATDSFHYIKITGYNPVKLQTTGNHLETATGEIIDPNNLPKTIAISRDLEKFYKMGDTVELFCKCPYKGNYRINDRLDKNAKNQIDILTWDKNIFYYGHIIKK